jgi:uncharacterized protein (UPF0332 family)
LKKSKAEIINYRIKRAFASLEEAKLMAGSSYWNTCVNRLYYSCFYAVSALMVKSDLHSSKHSGVRSIFNRNFVKPKIIPEEFAILYNDLYEYRQESGYTDFFIVVTGMVKQWILKTEEFIKLIANLTK